MKPLSDFFPRIATHVVGCPEPTMAQALVDAAIAFCEDSMVLREQLEPFDTQVDVGSYIPSASLDRMVSRVMKLSVDGVNLAPVPADTLPESLPERSGKPTAYYTSRSGSVLKINLYPVPDQVYVVSVQAAMRPIRDALQLDDDLYDLWIEPIVQGAVSRLAAIPNQPFSDPVKAQGAAVAAALAAKRARSEGAFGRLRGSVSTRVISRRFA